MTVTGALSAKLDMIGFRATGTVRDSDGNVVDTPPAPSSAQSWIAKGRVDDDIADLLIFLGRADNWVDLYKAVDMAEKIVGARMRFRHCFPDPRSRQPAQLRTITATPA